MSNKQKLLGNRKEGILFVFSAPAGCGKTTLVGMLKKEFPCVMQSVSCTTRQKRVDEVDGKHYHFLQRQDFLQKVHNNEFLEHVMLFDN